MMTNSKRNKKIKRSIYTIFSVGFFYGSGLFAEDYITKLDALIPPINTIIEANKTDRLAFTEAVGTFCQSMTNGDPMRYKSFNYNAKNSLFMYRLCNDTVDNIKIGRGAGLSDNADTSYVQFAKIRNSDGQEESVDSLKLKLPSSFEDTADYTQKLFDTITESYVTIYQASIYGKKGTDKESIDELIDGFSKANFSAKGTPDKYISICAKDKGYKYPQTCKKMTSYLKDAVNSLNSSSNILNTELLYGDIQANANCNTTDKNYNTIACGLYGNDITKFVNLVYNELFFYTSFIQYYVYILDTQPQFKQSESEIGDQENARADEISLIRANLSDSRRATKLSIRLLKELQMTFPMHIGFLMYTEGINNFVQKFNQTLIPIYTFGDIFRNVQDTK